MMDFFQLLPELLDALWHAFMREARQIRSGDWLLIIPILVAYLWMFADVVRAVVKTIHHKEG